MIFNSLFKDDDSGPPCIKCGSRRSGISTFVRRGEEYRWSTVTICEECLFKAVVGDVAFQRAVNASSTFIDGGKDVCMDQSEYISLLESGGQVKPKKWWQL